MKSKSETRAILTNFLAYIHTHVNTNIQTLISDNGQEFNIHVFYQEHDIIHQLSYVEHLNKMEGLRENINTYWM
jgi:hypothetical protein